MFVAILASCSFAVAATSELDLLEKQASANYSTREGQRYIEEFQNAIFPVFSKALQTCSSSTPDTKQPATFAFMVAADGAVKRMLYSTEIPFGICIGKKLSGIKTVPKPPRDGWVVALGAANHQNEERAKGPPDNPLRLSKEKLAAYDRAIAPYVAKARSTYPAAKKRFIAGLPRGHRFVIRVPLFDADGSREDSFVDVEKISGGKITGDDRHEIIAGLALHDRSTDHDSGVADRQLAHTASRWH